jgi:hypothetical protein
VTYAQLLNLRALVDDAVAAYDHACEACDEVALHDLFESQHRLLVEAVKLIGDDPDLCERVISRLQMKACFGDPF